MKKAEAFKDEIFNLLYVDSDEDMQDVYKFIKIVQKDVIREVVKECAEAARLSKNGSDIPYGEHASEKCGTWTVNKQSILSVVDKLIKEL